MIKWLLIILLVFLVSCTSEEIDDGLPVPEDVAEEVIGEEQK